MTPQCSPKNIDLCNDKKKAEIEKIMNMDPVKLDKEIEYKEKMIERIDEEFEWYLEDLQKEYKERVAEVSKKKSEINKAGLGLMKVVHAIQKSDKEDAGISVYYE